MMLNPNQYIDLDTLPPPTNDSAYGDVRKLLATSFTAADLGTMTFPAIRWIVPDILPEGATILAGRPKLGKSWLSLDIALAVARGNYCLGDKECEQGDVLYLALEDNPRRLKSRVTKVSPPATSTPWPDSLTFATEWPRAEDGGLEKIAEWIAEVDNPRLVIVDVLGMFRNGRGHSESLYESDYRAVKGLQELAGANNVAILIVHHVRKGQGDTDPFERVSGTMGLTGAADSTIILDRDGNGCSVYGRGRDMTEYELAVSFSKESCRWTIQGDAATVRQTDERSIIQSALLTATEPMSVKDITLATGMNRNACDQLLFKMSNAGEILKAKRGHYVHLERESLLPASTDKIENKKVGATNDLG